ncbi:MAG: DNA translocase FtsK, partial [Chlamydiia bacterium]|nr:DNA translocase FtsK [Chlamydiia bacterium]
MARKSKSSDIPEEPDSYSLPHEAKGVVLLSAAILLLLSLLSFHDGDDRSNWLGLAGFTAAWLCTYFFGLSSYCLPIFLGWWGWRSLWDKPANHLRQRAVYMLVAMVGSSLLLCVWAERSPAFQQWIGRSVYSRHEGPTYVHPPVTPPRYFVGGVPLHYIYADFPRFSLRRLLNDAGVLIVAGTMLLTAVLALGKVQIHTAPDLWERLRSKLKRSPKTDPPMTDGAASTKSFLPSLALPFHGWSTHQEEIDNSLVVDVEGEDEPFITPTTSPLPAQIDEADDEDVIVVSTSKAITPRTPQLAPSQAKDKQAIRKAALDAQRVWNGDYSRYSKPSPQQLSKGKPVDQSAILKGLRAQAQILEETLLSFGIEAKVGQIHCGPSITSFEVHPPVGVKVQKIRTLENDIALNMKAQSIRIIAPIPGKAAVGIEVPNPFPQEVSFREMLEAYRRGGGQFAIPVLLGKTVTGEYVMADLTKMPHCIIAGATGSGKSVCINTIVMSILMNAKPDEIRLLMVDPKKVELTPYTRLPHMLAPVITEPQGAYAALTWLVQDMERRYELLKQIGMRNIGAFNSRTVDPDLEGSLDIEVPEKLSYIVCIIDELADLMM